MLLGYNLSDSIKRQSSQTIASSSHLNDIISLIQQKYVDSLQFNLLYQDGVEGILSHLDPHTVYIPKEKLNYVNSELEGSFWGIGLEYIIFNDTLRVISIIEGTPSESKHLFPGDRIVKINNLNVTGKSLNENQIINLIRGKEGSEVSILVLHPDDKQEQIILERAQVPIRSIAASFMLPHQTAYIKINIFSEHTYEEFKKSLLNLKALGAQKIILDVRDNPGGYMDAVTHIADEFIAGKHILIETKGKSRHEIVKSQIDGIFESGEVAILINENSASASEILAGLMQDLDRGVVIGRRSYGKGLVQEQFELPDHSALRITTARYYLPSNRCIQKNYAEGKQIYRNEVNNRHTHAELNSLNAVEENSRKKDTFYTSKKRIVFGGEGIQPDLFIAFDSLQINENIQNIIQIFTSNYYYLNKNKFAVYTTFEKFNQEFTLDVHIKNEVNLFFQRYSFLLIQKIPLVILEQYIKASIAKIIFHNNGYYHSKAQHDAFIQKAILKLNPPIN